jgi:hypothetical protein
MRRVIRGRLSYREKLIRNKAALDYLADSFGKPRLKIDIPPPRTRRARAVASGRPLERHVLKAVTQALRYDPRVLRVERNQSGVFQDGNRYVRVGAPGKLDLTVYLKSGRYAEIEVKRDERTKPDPRQAERIEEIKRGGGIAGWCWSVESALTILP